MKTVRRADEDLRFHDAAPFASALQVPILRRYRDVSPSNRCPVLHVLNSEGCTSGELARILKAPRSKVSEWLARYEAYGIEGLLEGYRSGRPPRLTAAQREQLGDILHSVPWPTAWTAACGLRP